LAGVVSLLIPQRDVESIRRHGEAAYPQECCGFLIGRSSGEVKRIEITLAARNEREDSLERRYLISPRAYLEAEDAASARGLEVVGFYHSHPDHPARPSEFDRDHALPWCSYIIVAVADGKSGDLTSWVLSDAAARFDPEAITVLDEESVP
jgi:proteasome lid subunit RPN8/RPN11